MAKKNKSTTDKEDRKGVVMNSAIGSIVRKQESDYTSGSNTISRYVVISMIETLDRIDAYLNSKHTTGETDSLGREKPFFNIVTAAVNIWYRATDIDRKNIMIRAGKMKDMIGSFLATVHLQDWMRRSRFGYFLNDWGRTLARYGSSVVKFVEQGDSMIAIVVPWNRLIVDPVDFDGAPVIEIIELTEAQLRRRVRTHGYDRDLVEKLCLARASRKTVGGDAKDNKADYIKLYEVHGEFERSEITGKNSDKDIYTQQMHVITYVATKEEGKFDDYTLVKGNETKNPYMLTHLIKEDGQTLSIGAVQHLFEAQWMMNHTVKGIKDQLDLASKLVFQTADGNFVNMNVLDNIENGDILVHAKDAPLTQLQNNSHDIASLQNFGNQWKALSNEIVGISESMKGETAPSGTPWRQIDALLQESHSLFELMTENKGLHIEDMLREYIIPHLKKKMDTTKEVSATLESYDINRIDSMYIKNFALKHANKEIIRRILNDENPTPEEQQSIISEHETNLRSGLSSMGNHRFFAPDDVGDKTWKEVFKDLEWDVEVDITGEASTAKDDLTTLSTVFQTIADPAKQAVLNTPAGKLLFNKILMKAGGVSPLEIAFQPPAPIAAPTAPAPVPAT